MKFPYSRPLNIAHRGARCVAPENTLLAAQKALDFGADMWELDVVMSAEGELMLLHDDTLQRTSNAAQIYPQRAPWAPQNFTLAELRRLDFGSWFLQTDPFGQIAAGALSLADQQAVAQAHMPTLRQALQFTREQHWCVNVELKDLSANAGDAQFVEKTVALIEELGMLDTVLLSSFQHTYLLRARQINPLLKTAALVEEPVDDPLSLLAGLGVAAYNPGDELLTDLSLLPRLREAGYDVYVWTVNDPERMRALIAAGVSGIITDFPQVLAAILDDEPSLG